MVEHVLVGLDGSEQSWHALEYALAEFPDAEITVLHVIDPIDAGFSPGSRFPGFSEEWYEHAKEEAADLFAAAQERADEHGVELSTVRDVGRPVKRIVAVAEERGVDQLVVGSHGRSGVSRVILGSVAESVVRRSPVPVTVVR